jgi:predicted dehydrogenase/nucleoside-diphosphate-sugar epimerase
MAAATNPTRVALIGAGHVAGAHLDALRRVPDVRVVAVCDPVRERAQRLAARARGARAFAGLDELLAAGGADAAHVLVPPDGHEAVAARLLEAGLHVLVEKPLCLSSAGAQRLGELARARGVALAVDHNLTFDPTVLKLRRDVAAGRLGRLEHLSLLHHVPLRQLRTGDVSAFLFRTPASILFEQGVHPLSVVEALLGAPRAVRGHASAPRALADGRPFHDTWALWLECERGTAQVTLAFGRDFEERTVHAVGSDGAARLDLVRAGYERVARVAALDALDAFGNHFANAARRRWQALGAPLGYARGLFRLGRPHDPFLRSLEASFRDFHRAVRERRPPACDAASAARVLATIERALAATGVADAAAPAWQPPPLAARPGEVVVTGATGFLGRHVVPALQAAGHPVTVLVRRPDQLPLHLRAARVRVLRGDVRAPADVRAALAGARFVVHMATSAGDDPAATADAIALGAQVVGEACLEHGVERLVFVSSSAALYLGGDRAVRGDDGPDPAPRRRAGYARGKILAERALARLQLERCLPLVVLRPAIVLGEGGAPAHGGLGTWAPDNRCAGFGMGQVPLPLVLAGDVAAAIVAALQSQAALGRSYNLAGDVRWTAGEYVQRLRARTGRDLRFHPQPIWALWLGEVGKALVKLAAGRGFAPPSLRDLRSRGFFASLDCEDAKRDLGWRPEADPERFARLALPPPAR